MAEISPLRQRMMEDLKIRPAPIGCADLKATFGQVHSQNMHVVHVVLLLHRATR